MEKQLHQDIRSVNSRHFAAETESRSGENIERQDNGLEDDEPRFIFLGQILLRHDHWQQRLLPLWLKETRTSLRSDGISSLKWLLIPL